MKSSGIQINKGNNVAIIGGDRWRIPCLMGLYLLVGASLVISMLWPFNVVQAAGVISGIVFRDLNTNGTMEQ